MTPTHIVPEWYYLPFYAILRAIPNKLLGVIGMFGSIAILAFLPWLDTSRVRSANYRPLFRQFFWMFVVVSVGLGWLGSKPAEGGYVIAARILTFYYFAHFLIILPVLGLVEKTKPLPNSISEAMLRRRAVAGAGRCGLSGAPLRSARNKTMPAPFSHRGAAAGALDARHSRRPRAGGRQPNSRRRKKWSFSGPFGSFDRAQLQRGFKVYGRSAASATA